MRRYSVSQQTTRYDGKQVYKSTKYPIIKPSDQDVIIISSESDYLDTLAYKFYNDPTLWWVIALVNNVGKGRMSITPGTQLRIPQNINEIIDEFRNLNAV